MSVQLAVEVPEHRNLATESVADVFRDEDSHALKYFSLTEPVFKFFCQFIDIVWCNVAEDVLLLGEVSQFRGISNTVTLITVTEHFKCHITSDGISL